MFRSRSLDLSRDDAAEALKQAKNRSIMKEIEVLWDHSPLQIGKLTLTIL